MARRLRPSMHIALAAPSSTVNRPVVCAEKPIHLFRGAIALDCGKKIVPVVLPCASWIKTFGSRPHAMMTGWPLIVTNLAVVSLLAMPPLLTPVLRSRTISSIRSSIRATVEMTLASGSRGSRSKRPLTSLSMARTLPSNRPATMPARRSLSPNVVFNSSMATVSFSLIIGIAPISNNRRNVLRTFR